MRASWITAHYLRLPFLPDDRTIALSFVGKWKHEKTFIGENESIFWDNTSLLAHSKYVVFMDLLDRGKWI